MKGKHMTATSKDSRLLGNVDTDSLLNFSSSIIVGTVMTSWVLITHRAAAWIEIQTSLEPKETCRPSALKRNNHTRNGPKDRNSQLSKSSRCSTSITRVALR